MKRAVLSLILAGGLLGSGVAMAQAAPAKPAQSTPPLKLQKLGDTPPPTDPFPRVNPKFFTASTPTVDTVNSFLHALWGYDPNRIWRVEAIEKTEAPGVSKVTVFVSEKAPNAKVQSTAFYVLPDGKHAIADMSNVMTFGAAPFADLRRKLQAEANGPTRGSVSKDLMLVEFADLECPHCKEAAPIMDRLAQDFPNAHIVFQNFPLTQIHPYAFEAAAYGDCVAEQNNAAFFTYAQAVFDNQAQLTPESAETTLKNAVTKAGLDPAKISACATTQATKDKVNASIKLAEDSGVNQTPMLAINGHLVPMMGIPYETLKAIISFQAAQDGVGAPPASGTPQLLPRATPPPAK